MGIDPGLDRTGWAVLVDNGSAGAVLESCGLIHTSKGLSLAARLDETYREVLRLADIFQPTCAAMEEMFFLKKATRVGHTIQARGVILLALHQKGIEVSSYQPSRIKATLCGNGAADKKQMQRMVQLILKLKEVLQPDDVADAAAIALCHLKMNPILNKINTQKAFLEKIKQARLEQIKNFKNKVK